jgi:hypothetical protein
VPGQFSKNQTTRFARGFLFLSKTGNGDIRGVGRSIDSRFPRGFAISGGVAIVTQGSRRFAGQPWAE